MRIFGKKKKTEAPELTLVQVQGSEKYDFFSVLAKALLLFLLTYGALGGFLSAYDIEYNNGLCMLTLFGLALFLSAVYETGKIWIQNLAIIFYFILFVYITRAGYSYIINGYYAIFNRIYEVARLYLDVTNGMEYSLTIEETYLTITAFTLFLGMVLTILLNIMLKKKSSLIKVTLLTLPLYAIPFYFDSSPDFIYILFLLTGYLTVAILRNGNVNTRLAKQMRYVLPFIAVLTVLIVRTGSFILPENNYSRIVPKNALKEASEENMVQFAQYGWWAVFRHTSMRAGVSGGRLNKDAAVMPNYETVLKVRYTPYDFQPVYLKSFTGKDYLGDRWTQADDELPDDGMMLSSVNSHIQSYYGSTEDNQIETGEVQGRGIMVVQRQNSTDGYEYQPYYTDMSLTKRVGNVSSYVYYPAVSPIDHAIGEASEAYLEVPFNCINAVRSVCEEAGFSGTPEEITAQIVNFFQNNYSYTLRPGFYYGNPDYITHFLLESKRGYCAHFASAATMLFRYMGIHARYVEGFAFSFQDVTEAGVLVEDAEYSDYYEGYSPLGETALVELEILDSYAHAWVEIYVDGKGWMVVDPTPAQTTQDDATSFWDAFRTGNGNDTNPEMAESNLGAYLEGALGGVSYILPAVAGLFFVGLCAVYLLRAYREKKLPGRERVRLEYGRLQSYLSRKHRDYQKLRTLREQLDWIRSTGLLEVSDQQEEVLYQVYFAENVTCDCEELYRQLRRIRSTLKYSFHSRKPIQ